MTAADGVVAAAIDPQWTIDALAHVLGFGLLSCLAAVGVAFGYRGYSTRSIPAGGAALIGLSSVALWLNGAIWLGEESVVGATVTDDTPLVNDASAAYLLGVFVCSGATAALGRRIGDHLGCEVFDVAALSASGEIASLLRSAGLVVTVDLPETIDVIDGYASVDDAVVRELAGKSMRFPHRISREELRERIAARLRRDFDVDHVHVDVAEDGTVDSLAVGVQPAGIGPSLPPKTVAVAVRADPPVAAGVGDPVEVWTRGEDARLVATGTLRATVGDATTIVVDESNADAFAVGGAYRLVLQSDASDDVHTLASVLQVAEETVTAVAVEPDGPFRGEFVGWLPGRALVLERDGEVLAFPAANETLQAGDAVWILGGPDQLRRLAAYDGERDRREPPGGTGPDGESAAETAQATDASAAERTLTGRFR